MPKPELCSDHYDCTECSAYSKWEHDQLRDLVAMWKTQLTDLRLTADEHNTYERCINDLQKLIAW